MLRIACAFVCVFLAAPAMAQDGASLYAVHCSMCHDGGIVRAPSRLTLSEMTPERIVASLENGLMRVQGSERSADERRAIAVFLSGKPLGSLTAVNTAPRCTTAPPEFSAASPRD